MFWERFYKMCVLRGTKPNPLGKSIGISSGIISKWKSTGSLPNGESLIKIADYLDCSVDYLLGRTDVPEVNRGGLHLAYRAAHSSDDHEDELIYLTDEEVRRIEEAPETDEDF